MSATVTQASSESVRTFVQEYFDAWKGTDDGKILAYYADNVVIHLPSGILRGKSAVRDNFVQPFVAGFPGNVHSIRNLAFAGKPRRGRMEFRSRAQRCLCRHPGV